MIEAREITKSYGTDKSRFPVLRGISLKLEDGDFAVILGASGSGKSTFLNVISGLERPDSGQVLYEEGDITALSDRELTEFRKRNTGFIFQQYYLLPQMDVDKNVKMGADLAGNRDYRRVIQAVGLGDKLHKYPGELSGGEQQRVSVARALAKKPRVLFLDEPTASCIYTQKENKKIRKPLAADQTAFIFARLAAARLFSINSIRRLCWS